MSVAPARHRFRPAPRLADPAVKRWPPDALDGGAVQRLQVETHDAAHGAAVLEEIYRLQWLETTEDPSFSLYLEAQGIEAVSLEQVRLSGPPGAALVDGAEVIRVGQLRSGTLEFPDAPGTVATSTPFLLPMWPYSCRWHGMDLRTVSVTLPAVEAHAAGLLGQADFRLRFLGNAPQNRSRAQYWVDTITYFEHAQLGNSETLSSPLIRAEAFRAVATALLHTFPNTFLDRAAEPVVHSGPTSVQRAVTFMEEHLTEPIGLAEIAAAAGMRPRGLQEAFRRDVGATPLEHLRALRLHAAHGELLAADPTHDGNTVEAIAARWGFINPGRFAAAYRTRYGQNPALTLRT